MSLPAKAGNPVDTGLLETAGVLGYWIAGVKPGNDEEDENDR
jgi:hypothetical protein